MNIFMISSLEHNSAVSKELLKLMMIPVDNYSDISTLLKLQHYGALFEYFDYDARRNLSLHIVNNALESGNCIGTSEEVRSEEVTMQSRVSLCIVKNTLLGSCTLARHH